MDIQMVEVCKAMYTYSRQHSLSLFYACPSIEHYYHLLGHVLVIRPLGFRQAPVLRRLAFLDSVFSFSDKCPTAAIATIQATRLL